MQQPPLPFLTAESTSLSRPIQDYIRINQFFKGKSQEESDVLFKRLDADLLKLDTLRRECQVPDSHLNCAQLILRYISALTCLGTKLQIDESHARIPFPWTSGFTSRVSLKSKSIVFYNLNGELLCMLYNLGIVYHNIGAETLARFGSGNRNPDLIKQAAQLFQQAAGLFRKIQEDFGNIGNQNLSLELVPAHITALLNLNLATAQECFYIKACDEQQREGKMKDSTISKIAAACAEMLKGAVAAICADGPLKAVYQKHGWLTIIQMREAYFNSVSEFRRAKEALTQGKYGEEVARLRIADAGLKTVANSLPDVRSLHLEIKSRLKQAEKDNEIIYLDPVPLSVAPLEQAVLVKCTSTSFPVSNELFTMLYPPIIMSYLEKYGQEKENIVGNILNNNQSCIGLLDKCMADAGLPGGIQAVEKPEGLPKEILEKSEEIRRSGGAQSMAETRQSLRFLSQESVTILEKIEKALDQELQEDSQCRQQFGERWTRVSSVLLQKNFREQLSKHKETFRLAMDGDKVIDQKLHRSLHYIEALSSGKVDLEAMIPSSVVDNLSFSVETITSLKKLLKNSDIVRNEISKLSSEIKVFSQQDDIGAQLNSGDNAALNGVVLEQLKKYDLFKQRHDLLKNEVISLIAEIQSVNEIFRRELTDVSFYRDRQAAIQGLSEGYTTFKSLQENFLEGLNFYDNFKRIIQQLLTVTEDYCFARSTEKRDLLNDFAIAAANAPAGMPPALPPRP